MNEQRLEDARELARRCLAGQGHSAEIIERVARKIVAALPRERLSGDRRATQKIAAALAASQ